MIPIMHVSNKQINNSLAAKNQLDESGKQNSLNSLSSSSLMKHCSGGVAESAISGLSSTSLNNYLLNFTNLSQSQIPASMIQLREKIIGCDIYSRKSTDELRFFRDFYFLKFIEGLNKLNRADDRRSYSKAAIAYSEQNSSSNMTTDNCLAVAALVNTLIANNSAGTGTSGGPVSSASTSTIGGSGGGVSNPAVSTMSGGGGSGSINMLSMSGSGANTKNQMMSVPSLNIKQSNSPPMMLKSPKKIIYPLLNKYKYIYYIYKLIFKFEF